MVRILKPAFTLDEQRRFAVRELLQRGLKCRREKAKTKAEEHVSISIERT